MSSSDRPVGALVALAFNRIADEMLRVVHEAGFDDVQAHHLLNVFRFLGPGGERPARLAELAGVTPQAMSLLLTDLERLGYVERHRDPDDRRATVVTYSARGLQAGAVIERWYAGLEKRWASTVGQHHVDAARHLLAEIAEGR